MANIKIGSRKIILKDNRLLKNIMKIKIAVIIPCYRVKDKILKVIDDIPDFVDRVFVIDDCCPEKSGEFVASNITSDRLEVIFHDVNKGVGGALKTGYEKCIHGGYDIAVKIDGDGQMDPQLIQKFITPLLHNKADYTKGNRFFKLANLRQMPKVRLFGNSGLSFLTKLSTGHWNIMDPTNGYTAIRCDVLEYLDLDRIDNRYFFETDLLFQLGLVKARVIDIPMVAKYEDENSSLSVKKVLFEFSFKHTKLFFKRIAINYFLRDFNIGTILLLLGVVFSGIALFSGVPLWVHNSNLGIDTPIGTVAKYLLSSIVGIGGVIGWVLYDVFSVPNNSIVDLLSDLDLTK